MNNGPYLNDIKRNFTTRDSLGIEGINASIQADLCPVVNTVTPRAFYWAFMTWIYYDFYKYSGITERTDAAFEGYLKRQDYYFVMATILNDNPSYENPAGITQCEIDLNENDGPYPFNPLYLQVYHGGMQYYGAGCDTMQFTSDEDKEGNPYKLTRPTELGEEMALAFESVIKETTYYKEYRRNDRPVPRDVLKEYGRVINIALRGFDKCKQILRHRLFEIDPILSESAAYIKCLHEKYGIQYLNHVWCREMFFDHITPDGKRISISDDLKNAYDGWEIVIGRQYFTIGLEMIWKPMLAHIDAPETKEEWISDMINVSEFSFDLNSKVKDVIGNCVLDFDTREDMISKASKGKESQKSIGNGIKIIFSIYSWLKSRNDFNEDISKFLVYGADSQSIPLTELLNKVETYMNRSVKDFLVFIMSEWLIRQHYITALEKMLQERDGFYYEVTDGRYQNRGREFYVNFQGIRMIQLMQVMSDLDMLE